MASLVISIVSCRLYTPDSVLMITARIFVNLDNLKEQIAS